MIANLYLYNDSLMHNGRDSEADIVHKLNSFASDLQYILQYREDNKVYVDPNVSLVEVVDGKTIWEIISYVDHEERNLLFSVLANTSEDANIPIDQLKQRLRFHSQDECSAIIAFNNIADIDPDLSIIYDKQNWFTFRRTMLGIYPGDADFFINECSKYFVDLYFHENNKLVIGNYLNKFSRKILKYLSHLNDDYRIFMSKSKGVDSNKKLQEFSIAFGLDEHGSMQGDASKKQDLTHDFPAKERDHSGKDKEGIKAVCCEPHLKINKSDISGDTKYYQVRIYFNSGVSRVADDRILIGSIGPHVS